MAELPDPTRRLRSLRSVDSRPQPATTPATEMDEPPSDRGRPAHQNRRIAPGWQLDRPASPEEFAGGWVPSWDDDDDELRVVPLPGRTWDLGDADPDPLPQDPEDPLAQVPQRSRRRLPMGRWNRLRDRWVPESLQRVRLDPGHRGAILLSLIAALAAVMAAVGVWSGTAENPPVTSISSADAILPSVSQAAAETADTSVLSATIVVAVTGAVKQPGVVTLPTGARVADAIAAAGGIVGDVDYTGLNLAARLADGDSVVVGGAGQGLQATGGGSLTPGASAKVNLNTADEATLETLPGVGPVMAANILGWRQQNGEFTTVDQLQEITGIGPSRFATLAPLVTIG